MRSDLRLPIRESLSDESIGPTGYIKWKAHTPSSPVAGDCVGKAANLEVMLMLTSEIGFPTTLRPACHWIEHHRGGATRSITTPWTLRDTEQDDVYTKYRQNEESKIFSIQRENRNYSLNMKMSTNSLEPTTQEPSPDPSTVVPPYQAARVGTTLKPVAAIFRLLKDPRNAGTCNTVHV